MIDLLQYCDEYNCSYAAIASPDNDSKSIAYVLRFPFVKVYALNENKKDINLMRSQFSENNRIQIFYNAHEVSFYEMACMMPSGYSACFVLKAREQRLLQWINDIATTRPKKNDVLLLTNQDTNDSAIFNQISRFFGYTHEIGMVDNLIRIVPMIKFTTKGLGFYEDEHV